MTIPSERLVTPDRLILAYRQIRDKLKEETDLFNAYKAHLEAQQAAIERQLAKLLHAQKVTSFRTDMGTAYKARKEFVTVSEWEEFLQFFTGQLVKSIPGFSNLSAEGQQGIIAEILEGDGWQFLNRAVNKAAVIAYKTETGGRIPPGIKYEVVNTVKIRK